MKNKFVVMVCFLWGMCSVCYGMLDVSISQSNNHVDASTNNCIVAFNAFIDLVNISSQSDSLRFVDNMNVVIRWRSASKAFRRILSVTYGDFKCLEGNLNIDGFDFSLLANRIAWVYYRFYGCTGIRKQLPEFNSLYFKRLDILISSEYSKMLKKNRREIALKKLCKMNIGEKRCLASDQKVTIEELELLSQDSDFEVRLRVARNRKTPFVLLEEFILREKSSQIAVEAKENLKCVRTIEIDSKKNVKYVDDNFNYNILQLLSSMSETELDMRCLAFKDMLKSEADKNDSPIWVQKLNDICNYYSSDIRNVPFRWSDDVLSKNLIPIQEKVKMIRDKMKGKR